MGMGGQRQVPATLPPAKNRYPLYRRLGGHQGQSRRVRKTVPPPGLDPRTVQPVAGRYNDYWLRTSHKWIIVIWGIQDGDYKESLLLRNHIAWWICTDVSENCLASVFSVYQPRRWWLQLVPKRRFACVRVRVCVCVCVCVYIYIYIYTPTDLSKMGIVRSVCFIKYFLVMNAANGLGSI